MTAEGLAAVKAELERLTTVQRPEVVARIKHARELGDLRENADYEAARNEQSFLEGRILELEQRLRTAVLISAQARSAVSLGATVRYEVEGQPGELIIVGSSESDPAAGRVSASSPVGRALLGRRAGDVVLVATPSADIEYRIVEVR
jgi:transcription elongation factor GreA